MTLLSALLGRHYRFDDADPHWPDRDRLLIHTPDCSRTGRPKTEHPKTGQPSPGRTMPGVPAALHGNPAEAGATLLDGPRGLAFGAAVGMALAERFLAARFGKSLVDHRVWLMADAQELASGTAQEAAAVAGALTLGRLAVLAALPSENPRLMARFAACGWTVRTVAAGDHAAADAALSACLRSQKPNLVVEVAVAGKADRVRKADPGDDLAPRQPAAGDRAPADDDASIDTGTPQDTDTSGTDSPGHKRGAGARRAWLKRLRRHANRESFQHALTGHLPPGWQRSAHIEDAASATATTATPQLTGVAQGAAPGGAPATAGLGTQAAVRSALTRLATVLPDLAHLPLADPQGLPANLPGRGISWDGLDLAAPAALLGMALHGAMLPVSWASPAGLDWALPALRTAAARHLRWLHIVAAAASEAPPAVHAANLHVFTPADPAEAQDCLVLALRRMAGPSLLAVSPGRARLPAAVNRLCARGAYLVHAPGQLHPAGPVHSGSLRVATLLAAGMDVALALEVHAALAARGLNAALVSMPCRSLFDAQDADYRKMVLGDAPRIAFARDTHSVFAGLTGPGDLVLGERMTSCGIVGHGGVDHAAAADHRGSEPDARSLAGFIMRHLHRTTPELEPS